MRSRLTLLANDHRWKSEYKLLIDYSNVTLIDAPKEFCTTLKALLKELPQERLPLGIAYVFPDRLFYQCFETTHSVHSIEAACSVSFFRQEEAAIDWLEKLAIACHAANGSS
jgi:hypothetical protein